MASKETLHSSLKWFENKYHLKVSSFDSDVQRLISDLGPEGIEKLILENSGTVVYRGERLSREELFGKLLNLSQLMESSNHPVFTGPGSRRVKNNPVMWLNDEENELENLLGL